MKIPAYKWDSAGKKVEYLIPADHPVWYNFDESLKGGAVRPVLVQPQFNPPVLWQFCLTCGHGAHAACLDHQQKIPELGGRCPVYGCGCACIPGPYRDRLIREEEEERKIAMAGSVRGDRMSIVESGAVKTVRGLLGGGGSDQAKTVRVVEPEKK